MGLCAVFGRGVIVVLLVVQRTVYCDIRIVSSSPPAGSLVEEGGTVSFLCQTDRRWFLCLWTSPLGDKQCAIQESEKGASQVCQGDPRIMVQGDTTNCGITVSNVTREDWGAWMCLVQDGEEFKTDRREIDMEVGRKASVGMEYREEKNRTQTQSEMVLRVTEGEEEVIACTADLGYPRPSFSWEGPTPYTRRVRKYVKGMQRQERLSGNISHVDEVKIVVPANTLSVTILRTSIPITQPPTSTPATLLFTTMPISMTPTAASAAKFIRQTCSVPCYTASSWCSGLWWTLSHHHWLRWTGWRRWAS